MQGDVPGGPIRWRMHLAAPPRRVYDAFATQRGREAFWADEAPEREGAIHYRFANGYACAGRIVEQRSPSQFVFEYFMGTVRVELADDGRGGTDLLLVHEGVDEALWNEVHAGWLNVLFPLKAYVDHGVDLRNHDRRRTWNDGYADG